MKRYVKSEAQKARYNKRVKERRLAIIASATEKGRDATRLARATENEIAFLRSRLPEDLVDASPFDCSILPDAWVNQATGSLNSIYLNRYVVESPHFTEYTPFRPGAVVMAATGRFATDKYDEVSHLCGNAACLRPTHLTWESHAQNMARIGCAGYVRCQCCGEWTRACTHDPPCIKRRE